MARILSVDYGAKRTGMAMTDELQISINPLPTVDTKSLEETIRGLFDTKDIADVVFGLPTHADGQLTTVGHKVREVIKRLSASNPQIRFHTIDEAFTSRRARQMMLHLGAKKKSREQKSNIDKMSAVLILKDFIDKI